jgi:DNA-binding beta-propeller fold protein YncE
VKASSVISLVVAFSVVLLSSGALAGPPPSGYRMLKKIPISAAPGGAEYFDYITVDATARRVYVSHGTVVNVLDADNGSMIGTVAGLQRCHGVALVDELGEGFVTDGGSGEVIIFDIKTFQVTSKIKAELDADYILYDSASRRIFSFNGHSKNATVIDAAKKTVVATISMGGIPEQAVSDGNGTIYDNIEDTNELVAIDSRTLRIKARWPLAPAGQPVSMAMDREHRRLFIGGRNPKSLVVVNADNGKVLQSFPIGDRVDATVFDTKTKLVAASTREGTIHVFHEESPDKFSWIETIRTEFGAKTMALDPQTHRFYTDTSDFDAPLASTPQQPNPQAAAIPGSLHLLIYTP